MYPKYEIVVLGLILLFAVILAWQDWRQGEFWDWQICCLAIPVCILSYWRQGLVPLLWGGSLALMLNLIIYFTVYHFYGYEGYGQGDVLLMTVVGCYLGSWFYLDYFILWTFAMGLIATLLCLWHKSIKAELRLAPFILGGAVVFDLLGRPDFLNWLVSL